jgi:hypothetical protein
MRGCGNCRVAKSPKGIALWAGARPFLRLDGTETLRTQPAILHRGPIGSARPSIKALGSAPAHLRERLGKGTTSVSLSVGSVLAREVSHVYA